MRENFAQSARADYKESVMSDSADNLFSDSLKVFLHFAQCRNLAKTAEAFGVSLSSASRQIRKLEATLKTDLIVPGKRPFTLTPEARHFHAALQEIRRELHGAVDDLQEGASQAKTLRIGFIESYTQASAAILHATASDFDAVLNVTGTTDRLSRLFEDGEIDALVTSELPTEIDHLMRTTFLREPLLVVVPKSLTKSLPSSPNWNNLSFCGLPYIFSYKRSRSGKSLMSFLTTNGITFHSRIEVDNIGTKLGLIARGRGWSLIPVTSLFQNRTLIDELLKDNLAFFPIPEPAFKRRLMLVAKKDFPRTLFKSLSKTLVDYTQNSILIWVKERFPAAAKETEIYGLD